jgi:hypothetical protein
MTVRRLKIIFLVQRFGHWISCGALLLIVLFYFRVYGDDDRVDEEIDSSFMIVLCRENKPFTQSAIPKIHGSNNNKIFSWFFSLLITKWFYSDHAKRVLASFFHQTTTGTSDVLVLG